MPIKVACACGKKLSVKDEHAGKTLKCPACQKPLRVPKPAAADEPEDEWDLGDSAEEDSDDESAEAPTESRGGKSSASRGAASRKGAGKGKGKKSKSSNRGLLIGLSAGGGVLVVALLAWLLWPAAPGNNVANNPNGNVPENSVAGDAVAANPANSNAGAANSAVNGNAVAPTSGSGGTAAGNTNTPEGASAVPSVAMTPATLPLPRALTQVPEWLTQDAPFDVRQYWGNVPADQNAAPLYLDALLEFAPGVSVCFSEEVRQQRTAIVLARAQRSAKFQTAWHANPTRKRDLAERDAVLKEHAIGFQKLTEAQKRTQCAFDVGWDMSSQAILMQAAREAIRVGQLQVERDIEQGDLDAAVRLIGSLLRLSQDLRYRTPNVIQSIADAVLSFNVQNLVIPLLKSPQLKPSQCDALLRLFVQHEAALRANDPYIARLRGEYLLRRILLHDFQHQAGEFANDRF
jgi:hypothetical protein